MNHFSRERASIMLGSDEPLQVRTYAGPATVGPAHYHDFHELAFVMSGRGRYDDGSGNACDLVPGHVFMLLPGMVHRYFEQRELTVTNVLWFPDDMALPLYDLPQCPGYHALFELEPRGRAHLEPSHRLTLDRKQLEAVAAPLGRMEDEMRGKPPGFRLMMAGLFNQLLAALCRFYAEQSHPEAREMLRLDRAIQFMHEHYADPLRCKDMARMASMSEATFFRHFKRLLRVSPNDYLLEIRLRRAREQLLASEKGLTQIALECGFSDGNHLNMRFKRHFGVPPHRWRLRFRDG